MYLSIEDVQTHLKKFRNGGNDRCTYKVTKTKSGYLVTFFLKSESPNNTVKNQRLTIHFVKPRSTLTKTMIKHLGDTDLKVIVDSEKRIVHLFKR